MTCLRLRCEFLDLGNALQREKANLRVSFQRLARTGTFAFFQTNLLASLVRREESCIRDKSDFQDSESAKSLKIG